MTWESSLEEENGIWDSFKIQIRFVISFIFLTQKIRHNRIQGGHLPAVISHWSGLSKVISRLLYDTLGVDWIWWQNCRKNGHWKQRENHVATTPNANSRRKKTFTYLKLCVRIWWIIVIFNSFNRKLPKRQMRRNEKLFRNPDKSKTTKHNWAALYWLRRLRSLSSLNRGQETYYHNLRGWGGQMSNLSLAWITSVYCPSHYHSSE